jgi:Domain of unknown function (DUF4214)
MKGRGDESADVVAAVLAAVIDRMEPVEATNVLYKLVLGRAPDAEGLEYYKKKVANGVDTRNAAIRELLCSSEAQKYSLFDAPSGSADQITARPLIGIAEVLTLVAAVHRRSVLTLERLEKFEQLAQLTLLSVPEWCGEAYDRLERRVDELDHRSQFASQTR